MIYKLEMSTAGMSCKTCKSITLMNEHGKVCWRNRVAIALCWCWRRGSISSCARRILITYDRRNV